MSYVDFDYSMRSPGDKAAELQKQICFGPTDLLENQQGRLSGQQWDRILHREVAIPLLWSLLALIGGLMLRFSYGLFVSGDATEAFAELATTPKLSQIWKAAHGEIFENAGAIIAVGALLGLMETLRRLPYRLILDLLVREVRVAEGKVAIVMRGVNDGESAADRRWKFWLHRGGERSFEDWDDQQPLYKLRIDSRLFGVTKEVVQSIEEGQRYRAYYTRYDHRLVGLEPKQALPAAKAEQIAEHHLNG